MDAVEMTYDDAKMDKTGEKTDAQEYNGDDMSRYLKDVSNGYVRGSKGANGVRFTLRMRLQKTVKAIKWDDAVAPTLKNKGVWMEARTTQSSDPYKIGFIVMNPNLTNQEELMQDLRRRGLPHVGDTGMTSIQKTAFEQAMDTIRASTKKSEDECKKLEKKLDEATVGFAALSASINERFAKQQKAIDELLTLVTALCQKGGVACEPSAKKTPRYYVVEDSVITRPT